MRYLWVLLLSTAFGCSSKQPATPNQLQISEAETVETIDNSCGFGVDYICADDSGTWFYIGQEIDEKTEVVLKWRDRSTPITAHETNKTWWFAPGVINREITDPLELYVEATRNGEECEVYSLFDYEDSESFGGFVRLDRCPIPTIAQECSPECEMEGCTYESVDYDSPICVTPDANACLASATCQAEGRCDFVENFCQASVSSCPGSYACKAEGRCFLSMSGCVGGTHEACRQSEDCRTAGHCYFDPSVGCVPRDEQDCRQSEACKTAGRCYRGYGVDRDHKEEVPMCVASCDVDCAATPGCKDSKQCWIDGDGGCGTRKIGTLGERPSCQIEPTRTGKAFESVFVLASHHECSEEVTWYLQEREDALLGCYSTLRSKKEVFGQLILSATFDAAGRPAVLEYDFDRVLENETVFKTCVESVFADMSGVIFKSCSIKTPIHFFNERD